MPSMNNQGAVPASIHRFPPKLLDVIFRKLVLIAGDAFVESMRAPSCLAVTQVCRKWRQVAYHCSDIWTDIPLQSKEWTRIALERSRPQPITVRWCSASSRARDPGVALTLDINTLGYVLDELPRIRVLWLHVDEHRWKSIIDVVLDAFKYQSASVMDTLTIEIVSPGGVRKLKNLPPTVRSLRMMGLSLPVRAFKGHKQLRSLSLERCTIFQGAGEFMATLRDLPQLEYLLIGSEVLPDGSFYEGPTEFLDKYGRHRQVSLPNLRSLTMYGDPLEVDLALRLLHIPLSCAIILHYEDVLESDDPDDTDALAIVATLNDYYSRAGDEPVAFEHVLIAENRGRQLPEHHISATRPRSSQHSPGRMYLDIPWPKDQALEYTTDLLISLSVISEAKCLTVVNLTAFGRQEWVYIGECMEDVKKIVLKCSNGSKRALAAFLALKAAISSSRSVFPKLHCLVVELHNGRTAVDGDGGAGSSPVTEKGTIWRQAGCPVETTLKISLSKPFSERNSQVGIPRSYEEMSESLHNNTCIAYESDNAETECLLPDDEF
ncbi:hypothetical protein BV25DRAFT_1841647 [Artomyces pyxidatus]|uniref:Uncharacterized protein n=1 Tax=Artomyces pyxidatus TaxID=48021 RepID=A0ACB8SLS8_9AGAM|nr:hypothetical protein BV25DRAFT_1841647 [Artomyces pyxidatus]